MGMGGGGGGGGDGNSVVQYLSWPSQIPAIVLLSVSVNWNLDVE